MESENPVDLLGYPRWKNVNIPPDYGRDFHSCVIFKNFLIIYGGHNRVILNDVLTYNLKTLQWERHVLSKDVLRKRYDHTACFYEDSNQIVIFGGESRDKDHNVLILDEIVLATVNEKEEGLSLSFDWEVVDLKDKARLQRRGHVAHVYQGNMYVFGGFDQEKKWIQEVWCLDPDFNWTQKKINGDVFSMKDFETFRNNILYIVPGRTKSALFEHRVFMFGGSEETLRPGSHQAFYTLDLETFEGKLLYIAGTPSPRSGHTMELFNGKLYVFGGCAIQCTNELFTFDIEKEEWEAVVPAGDLPQRMGHHSCVCYKTNMIIFGGENKNGVLNEMYILELEKAQEKEEKIMFRPKSSHYLEHMKTMFRNKKYSDVCFEVEGQEFYCHRTILGARCQFFDSMFNSEMMESKAERIRISDIKASIFQELIRFIYCDEVELTEDNVFEILTLVDKYVLKDLQKICEEYLVKTLTLENFVSRGKAAEMFEINSLRKAVVNFGSREIAKIKENGIFGELSNNLLAEIIFKLHDKISILEKK